MWIRRGADSFSEDPDGGEDLVVEYLNDIGVWVALETFSGSGGPGAIFNRNASRVDGRLLNRALRTAAE